MTVRHILESKGRDVETIEPAETVRTAAEKLGRHRIGALVSLDGSRRIVGIVSERDIVRLIGQRRADALDVAVSEVMTRKVVTATEDMTVDEAMQVMTHNRFRHLPVCENDWLVGLVSIGDVVKRRIEDAVREADDLKSYISAG